MLAVGDIGSWEVGKLGIGRGMSGNSAAVGRWSLEVGASESWGMLGGLDGQKSLVVVRVEDEVENTCPFCIWCTRSANP